MRVENMLDVSGVDVVPAGADRLEAGDDERGTVLVPAGDVVWAEPAVYVRQGAGHDLQVFADAGPR